MNSFFKNFISSAFGAMFGIIFLCIGILVVVPTMIALTVSTGHHGKSDGIKNKSILHLNVHGAITERHEPMDFDFMDARSFFEEDRSIGLFEANKAIDKAKTDKRISGIYLDIHDFEGGWANVSSLRRHIEDFATSGKWVVAYAEHLDEVGYYLASSAKQIYMEPYGNVEFNGLSVSEMFYKGLLDKLGVEPLIFRVGRFKAAIEPLIRDKMSNENREQTQVLLDDIWSSVRTAAAKTSGLDEKEIDRITANMEVTSAETAKGKHLIYATAFADEVEDKLKEASVGEDGDLELVTPMQYLRANPDRKSSAKKVAVLFAGGEIHFGPSGADSIGSDDLSQDIQDAASDQDVAAIVLRIDSPGGDALASDVIWRALRSADDDTPVVVSMGDVAASGGYYIASAGRYIFAEPTTITGSIGVFGMLFNGEKALREKAGISFDRVVTHPHADIGSYSRPMAPEEGKAIQADVERVYRRFLDVVQDGRGFEKREELEGIAEGRVWSGLKAKDLGLIDDIGGLDQAVAKAAELAQLKDFRVEIYPADLDPFRKLIERFAGETMGRISWVDLLDYFWSGKSLQHLSKETVLKLNQKLKPGVYARLPFDYIIH